MNDTTGDEYLCHGLTWSDGSPRLILARTATAALGHHALLGRRLGLRTTDQGRYCTGRYRLVDTVHVQPLTCPAQARAESSSQCHRCLHQDEFRHAHHAHQTGRASPALERYLAQPHWLYIATFANGVSKVGTAAAPRKRSRLDEQGAVFATYLTQSTNGRSVRYLEDALTRQLNIPQSVRSAAKAAALARLLGLESARAAHEQTVERAAQLLPYLGADPVLESWTAPEAGHALRSPDPGTERALYPHDLHRGEHGFHIDSCIGSHLLVRLTPAADIRYVLDLSVLKGRRVVLGAFTSPAPTTQGTLF